MDAYYEPQVAVALANVCKIAVQKHYSIKRHFFDIFYEVLLPDVQLCLVGC